MPIITVSEARTQLSKLLSEANELGERFILTRRGRPAGVLLGSDEYDGLIETLEILSDPNLSDALQRGLLDAAEGRLVSEPDLPFST